MLTTSALLIGTSLILGQTADGPTSAYEHLKDREPFIGVWELKKDMPEEIEEDMPDWRKAVAGKPFTYRMSFNWGPDRGFQIIDTEWIVPGSVALKGKRLLAWDPSNETFKEFGVGPTGGWSQIIWTKQGADTWTGKQNGVNPEGEKTSSDRVVTLVDKDTLTYKFTNRKAGNESMPDTEGALTRVKLKK